MEENNGTPQLESSRFALTESEQLFYTATIEHGVTRQQVLNPAFFAHVAYKLRPYTEIRLRCDDGSLYARLLVLTAERTWARVKVLEWHDLTTRDVAQTQAQQQAPQDVEVEGYRVEWKGPHIKWRVLRLADSQVVREKEESRLAAQAWLNEYLKVTS